MSYNYQDSVLSRYLKDIEKTCPYTTSEQAELFRLCRKGDEAARDKLISSNMRFVLKVAIQYRRYNLPLSDLINEGSIGLIKALNSFDCTRGVKFVTYAVWWIRAYITRALYDNGNLVRIPRRHYRDMVKQLKEHGTDSVNREIAQMIKSAQEGISLDSSFIKGGKRTFSEVYPDAGAETAEKFLEDHFRGSYAHELLSRLPAREAEVLKMLYGISRERQFTLRETAMTFKVSLERVRQLKNQALKRLHGLIKSAEH